MSCPVPYLFHIGTQKAGSTYLYNLLSLHPELSLPKITEINYFSSHFHRGLDWYLGLFDNNRKIKLDTSPKYFISGQTTALRLKEYEQKYLGSQKPLFLLILRNPIDYLNSHFRMHLVDGFFERSLKYKNFPSDLIEFIKKYPEYLERAFYWRILSNCWFEYFSPEQFKIVIFEEFIRNPLITANEILAFWHLSPFKDINNIHSISKNKMLRYKFLIKVRGQVVKNGNLKNFLKQNKIFNYVYDKFLTQKSSQKLSASQRKELKNIFNKDVKVLEEFLGQKIESWPDFS